MIYKVSSIFDHALQIIIKKLLAVITFYHHAKKIRSFNQFNFEILQILESQNLKGYNYFLPPPPKNY